MDDRLRALAAPIARLMFARYLLASIGALAGDFILFLLLGRLGLPPVAAAFGGYAAGLAIHWAISVRYVFDTGAGPSHGQRLAFIASALLGMGMTMAMVGALSVVGVAPALAKLLSVPASFLTVYAIRKYGVFARA
ncbi:GtrA family protein [Sphingobium naphthae]|jgi:putative flippase GtrA|uniref:GtrA family protein n=1 Tax=Sphingobium naphthae TaxID=1886786 RepID=A0ABU4A094_9SPHN|nr:GtrA family protein [Sphingobium naphthae]MAN10847.1 polysaccharide biosynthesis protein GtrA [Sphingobium sp.]MEC7933393.1 GtrA family protein [Pseudomonadota bacterium]MCC4251165.1 GtrA family protein [Sphingobium naphthae]MDV5825178.1 GtrA family protein [Sphingobium naphthae]MEC8035111.1 GtrA family protein [Pseudomonadota bacterium]|tara:strand:- start:852 stop:1259 length:408 start_codon:yes stop_codon:yes gene_type:complete